MPQRPVKPDHHTDASVLSRNGTTTRNLDHASHAQNNTARALGHDRSVPVIPLQPQPRLRDPRPRPPTMLVPPTPLRLRDRPPRRAIRPLIPHRDQHPMHHISPHQRARAIDHLLDLPHERFYQRSLARPLRQPATRRLPRSDQPARPSCDHTPPSPPLHAATPSRHTPQESPSLPPSSSPPPSSGAR